MNIIALDDEKIALEALVSAIRKNLPEEEVNSFRRPSEALEYANTHVCDIAFLDIEMRGIDGITLAKELQKINPKVNIIFVTSYGHYASEAFSLYASGYVMKPVTAEKVRMELAQLRHEVSERIEKKLRAVTFGNFEVYYDGVPLNFKYSRTKELFAYLIDRRGALCSNNEVIAVLWDDESDPQSHVEYLKKLRSDLITTLTELGCDDVIERRRGQIGVLPKKIDCDLYRFLEGDQNIKNTYRGEYMMQYSWGEYTRLEK
ncbi:MAG: response regulator [Lachnospiraceae bacterium]|nr:response regulator [Lachnospiraceae bacterium]